MSPTRRRSQNKRRKTNQTADQVVADQVKKLRRDMTQQELADKIGWDAIRRRAPRVGEARRERATSSR